MAQPTPELVQQIIARLESPEGQAELAERVRDLDRWREEFERSIAVTPEMLRMRVTI